ncbi:MAG: 2-oxo acid dehydrogenase subunit E2 [Clostridia bacterium]|nr:2-oxo acid dehydrogenase subunit E2 [Clostridia bacterium]
MRRDGKLVKDVGPMYLIAPFIMTERSDSMNMIEIRAAYDPIHNYVIQKRKEGKRISHMAVVLAAYVRTVSQFKSLNRFVVRSRIYAHNDLSVGMVVLRPGEKEGTMGKIKFDLYDTVFDVNEKIDKYVEANSNAQNVNGLDKIMKAIIGVPGLMRFLTWLIRFADRHGLLPRAICDISPFHESMVFTNLASIKTNHIYHHIYNFGTCNMIMAMGNTVETPRSVGGEVTLTKEIPFGLVMDERIADGHYFAEAFAAMKKYLADPSLLETPPQDVEYDFPFPTLSSRFPTKKQIKAEKKAAKKAAKEAKKAEK